MSKDATSWAWRQPIKPASAKLVLLCLAKCHNQTEGRCNPSVLHISEQTGLDRKTVITSLATLESVGAFQATRTYGSWTQYNLQTSTEIGSGRQTETSPENGTGEQPQTSTEIGTCPEIGTGPENGTAPVPKTVPVEGEKSGDQSRNRDTKEKTKRIKDKTFTSEHMRLAEWIWEKVQATTRSAKQPNLDSWADDIRKLNLLDNRDLRLIAEVFSWANRDTFWQPNILSPAKLREKFDTLFVKYEGERNGRNQKPAGFSAHQARPKLTPAQRVAAKRDALRSQQPDLGAVATDDGDLRSPVVLAAGGRTE